MQITTLFKKKKNFMKQKIKPLQNPHVIYSE